jgi:hypothetical protein
MASPHLSSLSHDRQLGDLDHLFGEISQDYPLLCIGPHKSSLAVKSAEPTRVACIRPGTFPSAEKRAG